MWPPPSGHECDDLAVVPGRHTRTPWCTAFASLALCPQDSAAQDGLFEHSFERRRLFATKGATPNHKWRCATILSETRWNACGGARLARQRYSLVFGKRQRGRWRDQDVGVESTKCGSGSTALGLCSTGSGSSLSHSGLRSSRFRGGVDQLVESVQTGVDLIWPPHRASASFDVAGAEVVARRCQSPGPPRRSCRRERSGTVASTVGARLQAKARPTKCEALRRRPGGLDDGNRLRVGLAVVRAAGLRAGRVQVGHQRGERRRGSLGVPGSTGQRGRALCVVRRVLGAGHDSVGVPMSGPPLGERECQEWRRFWASMGS